MSDFWEFFVDCLLPITLIVFIVFGLTTAIILPFETRGCEQKAEHYGLVGTYSMSAGCLMKDQEGNPVPQSKIEVWLKEE